MRTIFSTANVHPRDRFDYWHDVARTHILDHNAKPESRHDFYAELLTSSLANINLILFENSPMEVWHTARQASVSTDEILLCRQVAGTLTLQQDSRNVILEPDDFTLIEPLRPYNAQFLPGSKVLIVKIPRRSLEARIGKARGMTAHCIKPSNFENKLASTCLGLLATHRTEISSRAEEIVTNKVLDLIALSLGKSMEGATPRVMRPIAGIYDNCGDRGTTVRPDP